jgi:adenylate cyclase
MWSPPKTISLRVSIVLAYIALTIPPACGMLYYIYYRSSESILTVGNSFIERASAASIQSTTRLIDQLGVATKGVATLGRLDPQGLRDHTEKTLYYLYEIVRLHPAIYAATLSFEEDGMFMQIVRLPPGTQQFGVNNTRPPDGAKYVANVTRRRENDATSYYEYFAEWGHSLLEETWPTTFDPRNRPFYKLALGKTERTISDVFAFASTGKPGIVISHPIYAEDEKFVGVAGALITLDNISDFLRTESDAVNGAVFIMDENGFLVAHPQAGVAARQVGRSVEMVKAEESGEPLVAAAVKRRRMLGVDHFFMTQGEPSLEYAVSVVPFPQEVGEPWLLVTIVPTNTFLSTLYNTNKQIIFVGIVALLFAVSVVLVLATRITRPIEILRAQANQIRSLEFSDDPPSSSWVSEIQHLMEAMNAMKKTIRAFGSFVPRELVRQLLSSGTIRLDGESQYVTIFFSDVVGFSTLAEIMPARELIVHVSAYLEAVAQAVTTDQGTVDKYIGDSVMAFWGAPNPLPDHSYHACLAALRAWNAVERLNHDWAAAKRPQLQIRIGIHTDTAIVGNIGSWEHMSYTVMGDGVNVASRLEKINREYGTRICVSHTVYREAGDRLWLRPIDRVTVKGRREALTIYELVGIRDADVDVAASPLQQEFCALTTEAFAAYQEQRWPEAISLYQQLAERFPNDRVASILLERCRAQGQLRERA